MEQDEVTPKQQYVSQHRHIYPKGKYYMPISEHLPTIAVLNTSEDYLNLMQLSLNAEGFVASTMSIAKIKSGETDIVAYLQQHDPKIIMYDIAFPFKENW